MKHGAASLMLHSVPAQRIDIFGVDISGNYHTPGEYAK
jgi:hypothetical protein